MLSDLVAAQRLQLVSTFVELPASCPLSQQGRWLKTVRFVDLHRSLNLVNHQITLKSRAPNVFAATYLITDTLTTSSLRFH